MIKLNIKKSAFAQRFFPLLYDYTHRWEVYMGSSGSGKSYFITQKLILRALKEPIRILVCRRYATTIRQTCFDLFKNVLNKWKLIQNKVAKVNESDYRIKFINGSEIIFSGLDEETKLLSLSNISCVFIEEVYEVPQDIVEQLNIRLRGERENLQIIMAFNPISKHHWLYDFCEVRPPESFVYSKSTFRDNPFLNKETVKALLELYVRNPQKARVFCDGEWGVDNEGLVYKNWFIKDFENFEFDDCIFGLDFGYVNDPSAFVAAKVNKAKKEIYVFDELYKGQMINSEIANWIIQKGYSKELIIADCAEQKSIEEIKRKGVYRIKPCWKGKGSILTGIDVLQDYKIYVSSNCENMIMELENYTWKKDKNTNKYVNEPIDEFNHLCDALRYAIQKLSTNGLKTMSKSVLGL